MAVYAQQSVVDFNIKVGFSEDQSMPARLKSHTTRGGDQRHLGYVPGADRSVEQWVFDHLRDFRIGSANSRRRDYEIFAPAPGALKFFAGAELHGHGWVSIHKPRDPAKQTTVEWLEVVQYIGKGGTISQAARWAISENQRLRALVPRSARGGWDLNEAIGGPGFIDRQVPFEFESRLIDGRDWLIRRITYKGASFDFPVFAEWYERQTGRAAPPRAIRAGLVIRRPKLESGRKGISIRKPVIVADADYPVIPGISLVPVPRC